MPGKKVTNRLDGIRDHYAEVGVESYYLENGNSYQNPHFPQVRQLLINNQSRIDYSYTLDFCCGSGEVSLVLQELGYPLPTASDPFTSGAYRKNFNRDCLELSFADIIRGKLIDQFSAIICSFAMHLCPPKQLYPLTYQLFQCTSTLIIITPHKRPMLEELSGVVLRFEDFVLTERGKKVRLKGYERL